MIHIKVFALVLIGFLQFIALPLFFVGAVMAWVKNKYTNASFLRVVILALTLWAFLAQVAFELLRIK